MQGLTGSVWARCRDLLAQCGQDAGTYWLSVGSVRRFRISGKRFEGEFPLSGFPVLRVVSFVVVPIGVSPARGCCFLAGPGAAGFGRAAPLWCVPALFLLSLVFPLRRSKRIGDSPV